MNIQSKPTESIVAGIIAKHAIITPVCRKNKTNVGAFEEAVERLRNEYNFIAANRKDPVDYHLVLTVE